MHAAKIKASNLSLFAAWPVAGFQLPHLFTITTSVPYPKSRTFHTVSDTYAVTIRRWDMAPQSNKRLLDNLPNLVCIFRPDGTLTYVNRAYAKVNFSRPAN
jgi:PAS domain-containing protein